MINDVKDAYGYILEPDLIDEIVNVGSLHEVRQGELIMTTPKNKSITRYLLGGTIFGLGWAMTGACPGPMFVLLGKGIWPILLVIFGSVIGTFLYGLLRDKLPH